MIILERNPNLINMLRNKVTEKIKELQTDFTPMGINEQNILGGFKAIKLSGRFKEFNIFKERGYSFTLVLSILIMMVVSSHQSVYGYLSNVFGNKPSTGKDVFYRLKNNEHINWRMILWRISTLFLKVTSSDSGNSSNKPCYLIFDDSTLEKTGRKLEFIGRVWDHVQNKYVLGFKLLVMLYWDGVSSIPLDFSLHMEKGKNSERPYGMKKRELARRFSHKRVKASESVKRIKELNKSKIEMVLKMFYCAVYRCLKIDYVLVDSWFTCESLIRAVREVKKQSIHLIGMYKIATAKFLFEDQKLTHAQINNKLGKPKRCRSLKYQYKRAEVMLDDIPVVLFFSRQGGNGKWKVILTTDTSLSFTKLLEHYSVRWTIEVFFKETKQLLNLGKCQSNNFDAQIADTTISMIAYILLSLRYRYDNYESMGALYRAMNADILRQTLDRRLWGLIIELLVQIALVFDTDIDSLLEKIFTNNNAQNLINKMMDNSFAEAG